MYSLDYSLKEAISFYLELIRNYSMFYPLLIAITILGVIMLFNVDGHNNLILTIGFNILCLLLTFNHFGLELLNHLDSCLNSGFMGNICLFFINTIFALIVTSSSLTSSRYNYSSKVTMIILYLIMFLNISFAIYVTYSINTNTFITIGNIYPMIIIGNILTIIVYTYLIITNIIYSISKQYDKKKHLLYR